MSVRTVAGVFAIIFGFSGFNSCGASVSIDAAAFGWYAEDGRNDPANIDTFTGTYVINYRSWFLFDLSSVPTPVTSVTLQLETEAEWSPLSQGVNVFDVASSKAELIKPHEKDNPVSEAIYADLGSGSLLGTYYFGQVGQVYDLSLDSQALFDINNSTDHLFAVGLDAGDGGVRFSFVADQPKIHRLVITTVPEPQSLLLSMIPVVAFQFSTFRFRRD